MRSVNHEDISNRTPGTHLPQAMLCYKQQTLCQHSPVNTVLTERAVPFLSCAHIDYHDRHKWHFCVKYFSWKATKTFPGWHSSLKIRFRLLKVYFCHQSKLKKKTSSAAVQRPPGLTKPSLRKARQRRAVNSDWTETERRQQVTQWLKTDKTAVNTVAEDGEDSN